MKYERATKPKSGMKPYLTICNNGKGKGKVSPVL